MKIEQILDEWEEDSQIPSNVMERLTSCATSIPKLHAKYLRLYTKTNLSLSMLESEFVTLKSEKYEFYTQGPTEETNAKGWVFTGKVLKSEVQLTRLDSDPDLIKLSLKIVAAKEKSKLLESILKQIGNRSFIIKNIIDWEKFKTGG